MRTKLLSRVVVLVLGGFLLCSCSLPVIGEFGAPTETSPGEIRFELAPPNGAAILVPIKINGQGPYTFVLDTGATFTCIDQRLATELNLPEWKGPVGVGLSVSTPNAASLVNVNSIEVGTATARELKACVIDFRNFQQAGLNAHGLLGLNFLKPYRVTIDFNRQVVTLDQETKKS